ncbi:hypothetical protein T484DRAFT_3634438 [Baffinella frigidus]|nr:hypothetical protein T484DRAFT_3634438 [Cryptophyta sp. CCMP2293]
MEFEFDLTPLQNSIRNRNASSYDDDDPFAPDVPHSPDNQHDEHDEDPLNDDSVFGFDPDFQTKPTPHTHKGEKDYICNETNKKTGKPCGKAFTVPDNLTKHINVVHENKRDHVCEHVLEEGPRKGEECGECFGHKHDMERHMMHHTGEYHSVCEFLDDNGQKCGKGCTNANALVEHVMTNHTDKTSPEYLEYREKDNKYRRERYTNDAKYRVTALMPKSFRHFMKNRGGKTAVTSHTQDVVGCTWDELVAHLHNNPHGYTLDTEDIQVDHIRPVNSFNNLADPVDEHRCMNFNNLQLLPWKENNTKRAFYDPVAYALTEASKAIEKLVSGWTALYLGVESV